MLIQSIFKSSVIVPVAVFLGCTAALVIILYFLAADPNPPLTPIIVFIICFGLIWCWLFFVELRKRALKIVITNDEIKVSAFAGFGPMKSFRFSETDGFETVVLPSEHRQYEYLFIMQGDSRIVAISQFYHKNYLELKLALGKKLRFRGEKKFKIGKELSEMLK